MLTTISQAKSLPCTIAISVLDGAFVLKVDNCSTFYQSLEELQSHIIPSIRMELLEVDSIKGSC